MIIMEKAKRTTPSLTFVQSAEINLVTFSNPRQKPVEGDLFMVNLCGERWVAGRVICTSAVGGGISGAVLVYFYRQPVSDPLAIATPINPELACAQLVTGPAGWSAGLFVHIRNEPLLKSERLPNHYFAGFPGTGEYRDEFDVSM